MNITTLILATLSAVSVSLPSVRSPVSEPLEPVVMLFDGDGIRPLEIEEYVTRCVMHEVPYTFAPEAMKAQAVAARTYLYHCLENGSRSHTKGEVCTDVAHCMGYVTKEAYAEKYGSASAEAAYKAARAAAEATSGEVLTYGGEHALTVWHACSDGFTEDSGDVWLTSLPYLTSVSTPEEEKPTEASFTRQEVKRILTSAGYKFQGLFPLFRTDTASGRCKALTLGSLTLNAGTVRSLFGLRSTDFSVTSDGSTLTFTVRGYGHGVGMSQRGADAMARAGFGYRDILAHYYTGTLLTQKRTAPSKCGSP